jgi:transposase
MASFLKFGRHLQVFWPVEAQRRACILLQLFHGATKAFIMSNGKSMFQDWRESRRIRAYELKQMGWKQSDIAAALGVTKGAVSQWLKRAEEGGKEALRSRPTPGRPARLSPQQKAQIPELLKKGPEAFGFRGDTWTAERVAEVIEKTFGVRYHPDHVGRLLRDAGWTSHKHRRQGGRGEASVSRSAGRRQWGSGARHATDSLENCGGPLADDGLRKAAGR